MNWQVECPTAGISQILPNMITDIVLESPKRANGPEGYRLVIDTKFTDILGMGQFSNPTLKSEYIYPGCMPT